MNPVQRIKQRRLSVAGHWRAGESVRIPKHRRPSLRFDHSPPGKELEHLVRDDRVCRTNPRTFLHVVPGKNTAKHVSWKKNPAGDQAGRVKQKGRYKHDEEAGA